MCMFGCKILKGYLSECYYWISWGDAEAAVRTGNEELWGSQPVQFASQLVSDAIPSAVPHLLWNVL